MPKLPLLTSPCLVVFCVAIVVMSVPAAAEEQRSPAQIDFSGLEDLSQKAMSLDGEVRAFDTKVSFATTNLGKLFPGETFGGARTVGDEQQGQSPNFDMRVNAKSGVFAVTRREESKIDFRTGVPPSSEELRQRSLAYFRNLGITQKQVGRVDQKPIMVRSRDRQGRSSASEVHSHATFVYRQINGIPVQGHHATVLYGKNGKTESLAATWPSLAGGDGNHNLGTALKPADIARLVDTAMRRDLGVDPAGFAVKLDYAYHPAPLPDGTVGLQLGVIATVRRPGLEDGKISGMLVTLHDGRIVGLEPEARPSDPDDGE